mmetsp:Transcript_15795/g.35121  ORF Transcript_15795/g.35121 Transcript_15795/m.35121 type:complete len:242 (+) Transcript_15795:812-1537(+)
MKRGRHGVMCSVQLRKTRDLTSCSVGPVVERLLARRQFGVREHPPPVKVLLQIRDQFGIWAVVHSNSKLLDLSQGEPVHVRASDYGPVRVKNPKLLVHDTPGVPSAGVVELQGHLGGVLLNNHVDLFPTLVRGDPSTSENTDLHPPLGRCPQGLEKAHALVPTEMLILFSGKVAVSRVGHVLQQGPVHGRHVNLVPGLVGPRGQHLSGRPRSWDSCQGKLCWHTLHNVRHSILATNSGYYW